MATYNSTGSGTGGIPHQYTGRDFTARVIIDVPTIIAAHATLTANAKITAGDIIQIWDIPANCIIIPGAMLYTITAGQASNTADIGITGGDQMFDGVALDSAAGTKTMQLVGDDWGSATVTGVSFAAADTLDMKFVADATTGKYILFFKGYIVDLTTGLSA